jgi:Flp pilus assembly protein TadD
MRYLWLTIWPHALVLYYGRSTPVTLREVWPYVALVTGLFCIALVQVLRGRPFGFLAFWAFLTVGPTSSFVPIAMEVGAERRMYLPLAGIITMAVVAGAWLSDHLARGKHRTQIFAALVIMIAIPLSMRTVSRNREYSTPLVMARTVLERWPIPSSHYIVGMELSAAGEHEAAIEELRRAAPGWPLARFRLGIELINAGRPSEGAAALERFISDEPGQPAIPIAHGQLANIFSDEQRFDEAIPHYRAYLNADPSDADAWNALGIAEMRTFRLDDALESFGHAVRLRPRDARLWMNLGNALRSKGRVDDARRAFKSALDADPSFAPAAAAIRELQGER